MEAPLETQRLILRPFTDEDVLPLAAILADPRVMRYSVAGVCSEADTRRFVQKCRRSYQSKGYSPLALERKDAPGLIGFCGLAEETLAGEDAVHLGYRLAAEQWQQGLASEAASAVLDWGFADCALAQILAVIRPDHPASLRVAEKAGFRDHQAAEFYGQQVRLYRLHRAQWAQYRVRNGG